MSDTEHSGLENKSAAYFIIVDQMISALLNVSHALSSVKAYRMDEHCRGLAAWASARRRALKQTELLKPGYYQRFEIMDSLDMAYKKVIVSAHSGKCGRYVVGAGGYGAVGRAHVAQVSRPSG